MAVEEARSSSKIIKIGDSESGISVAARIASASEKLRMGNLFKSSTPDPVTVTKVLFSVRAIDGMNNLISSMKSSGRTKLN